MNEVSEIVRDCLEGICKEIESLKQEVANSSQQHFYTQEWYNLDSACKLKGINKKTTQNKPYLQPNGGVPDGKIGGRKAWRRATIESWVTQDDKDIERCQK